MGNNPAYSYGVGNDYPVYYVSWNDITQANGFLDRLDAQTSYSGFRLPTEAEWEYACRAGTQTRFYFGDSLGCDDYSQNCTAGLLPGNRSDYMWYLWSNGYNGHPPGAKGVATLLPNQFGLYDMSGNLWEWCEDWFQEDFYSQPGAAYPNPLYTNPASGYRVVRGGDWDTSARTCRSAVRYRGRPPYRFYFIGFRVVLPSSSIDQ
jgi:formylglycine-generating enzyme required for sulfatase activity